MSEAKHTPGPWQIADENNNSCSVLLGIEHNLVACLDRQCSNTWEIVIERDEMLANARLIAAAPDLLDALQRLLNAENDEYLTPIGVRNLARAAISKATGKTQ